MYNLLSKGIEHGQSLLKISVLKQWLELLAWDGKLPADFADAVMDGSGWANG